jgi:hypothetical protein
MASQQICGVWDLGHYLERDGSNTLDCRIFGRLRPVRIRQEAGLAAQTANLPHGLTRPMFDTKIDVTLGIAGFRNYFHC